MAILIGFLTFILVMNCLFLILLILIQLPKKEAGAGIAFGGGATDALFGAGSGNALTKMTKYSGTIFVGMAVLLSVLNLKAYHQRSERLEQELSRQASSPAAVVPTPAPTLPQVQVTPSTPTNPTLQMTPEVPMTNLMTKPATSAVAPITPAPVKPVAPATTPAPQPK